MMSNVRLVSIMPEKIKAKSLNAVSFCDPVMGHTDKGYIVADGVGDLTSGILLVNAMNDVMSITQQSGKYKL